MYMLNCPMTPMPYVCLSSLRRSTLSSMYMARHMFKAVRWTSSLRSPPAQLTRCSYNRRASSPTMPAYVDYLYCGVLSPWYLAAFGAGSRSTVLQCAVLDCCLSCPSQCSTADQLFDNYDAALREIADRLAPEHTVQSCIYPLSLWFDADCRAARRHCHRLERCYRRTVADADQAT